MKAIKVAGVILASMAILFIKDSIDRGNLLLFKSSNKNVSVYKLVDNLIEKDKKIKEYDNLFKTAEYKDNTIYYTDKSEPVLKLVYAYLDKAKLDNSKLFGEFSAGKLAIKFDYGEDVFKKRNPSFNDSAGLYFKRDKTVYIFMKDCYANALSLGLNSLYLRHVLLHEYTHHVFYEFLNLNRIDENKIPVRFMEGVSEYIGWEEYYGPPPEKMAAFSELNTQKQWTDYSNKGYDVYEQSHYAIRRLIIMKGERVIRDILLNVKDKNFDAAFNEAAGISLQDYEKVLNEDFKNGWKEYNNMVPAFKQEFYRNIHIECFEEYIRLNPDNVDALLDLAQLYDGSGKFDKELSTLNKAVEKGPKNMLAWHALALFHERMMDFDSAIRTFERETSIDKDSDVSYNNLCPGLACKRCQ